MAATGGRRKGPAAARTWPAGPVKTAGLSRACRIAAASHEGRPEQRSAAGLRERRPRRFAADDRARSAPVDARHRATHVSHLQNLKPYAQP